MSNYLYESKETGIAKILIILAVVVVVGGGLVLWLVLGSTSPEIKERNAKRTADATSLLNAAKDFASKNDNKMPTQYFGGVLAGPSETELSGVDAPIHYSTITVKSGAQSAVSGDNLVLVTGAQCEGGGGATAAAAAPAMAVQYTQEKKDGSLAPKCEDNDV